MTDNNSDGRRLPWTTPQLRRIEAGSAETTKTGGLDDNGPPNSDKS